MSEGEANRKGNRLSGIEAENGGFVRERSRKGVLALSRPESRMMREKRFFGSFGFRRPGRRFRRRPGRRMRPRRLFWGILPGIGLSPDRFGVGVPGFGSKGGFEAARSWTLAGSRLAASAEKPGTCSRLRRPVPERSRSAREEGSGGRQGRTGKSRLPETCGYGIIWQDAFAVRQKDEREKTCAT